MSEIVKVTYIDARARMYDLIEEDSTTTLPAGDDIRSHYTTLDKFNKSRCFDNMYITKSDPELHRKHENAPETVEFCFSCKVDKYILEEVKKGTHEAYDVLMHRFVQDLIYSTYVSNYYDEILDNTNICNYEVRIKDKLMGM